ncbi:hypothetical protein Taro_032668 [Colocasia esculenta]|uniref:Uncharacterized protein n=1 Tax=Colocasia esculenta TaxID=4460 RepID=A0A843W2J5_COLES|nr:hypothetical protein [Colocasia esculenta]
MAGLSWFRSLQLCYACRPEKLASISLDARISVGVHVWTLTPAKRPGVDDKMAFGQNSEICRKPCIPCIYTYNMYTVRVLELDGVVWRSSWWLGSCGSTTRSSSSSPFVCCNLHKPSSWSRAKVTMTFKRKSKSRMEMRPSDERSSYESIYS